MTDTTPLFFYGTGKKYGEFSQWYHAKFTVLKGEIYSVVGLPTNKLERPDDPVNFMTAEQCMMYCKAMRFGDLGTADKILLSPEPRKQKALGRQVKGFTEAGWDAVKFEVVQLANVAKFSQNEELRAILLGTGDRELVEAATNDRIWGIGMDEKQGRATMNTRENWGHNLLGKALVGARVRILIEDSITVTQAIGLQFLWVDRICIDHSNHGDTLHQIRQMDLIYANSEITIIAAACNTPDDGLPGINRTSRANQQTLRIKNTSLTSTLPSGTSIEQSKWYTRGWTFQEGVLSTKRLIFPKTQVIFDCNGMHCSEALDLPLDKLHDRYVHDFD
ncbi:unnamed protein product [Clonostachys rosea f. rosea IK726]|uniref:Uncharacterized protein n=1 Tax=Clonostachys rosea f. rosea IK726 TaxID=1349383 RepID=A0ACA9UTK6_BIOOC|nr:unnamed protein product [Clonostachys rosea f. rosea IK726]